MAVNRTTPLLPSGVSILLTLFQGWIAWAVYITFNSPTSSTDSPPAAKLLYYLYVQINLILSASSSSFSFQHAKNCCIFLPIFRFPRASRVGKQQPLPTPPHYQGGAPSPLPPDPLSSLPPTTSPSPCNIHGSSRCRSTKLNYLLYQYREFFS